MFTDNLTISIIDHFQPIPVQTAIIHSFDTECEIKDVIKIR